MSRGRPSLATVSYVGSSVYGYVPLDGESPCRWVVCGVCGDTTLVSLSGEGQYCLHCGVSIRSLEMECPR